MPASALGCAVSWYVICALPSGPSSLTFLRVVLFSGTNGVSSRSSCVVTSRRRLPAMFSTLSVTLLVRPGLMVSGRTCTLLISTLPSSACTVIRPVRSCQSLPSSRTRMRSTACPAGASRATRIVGVAVNVPRAPIVPALKTVCPSGMIVLVGRISTCTLRATSSPSFVSAMYAVSRSPGCAGVGSYRCRLASVSAAAAGSSRIASSRAVVLISCSP